MSATNSWYAIKESDVPVEKETGNTQGETLLLQILGDATAFNIQIFGRVDLLTKEWVTLNSVNMTTLDIGTSIEKKGVFMAPIDGIASIKVKLNSVSGGKVSAFCRITKGD